MADAGRPLPEPWGGRRRWLLCVALALVTFAVYAPVRGFEFVRYDDDLYVPDNPRVSTGLSLRNVQWAFTTTRAVYWHPLTWLSHQADCQLFGLDAGAHHLVNVLFHAANGVLLFLLLCRVTRRAWPSAFVAALFALHPLHVESVAWVSQRKDVLSTFLGLSSLLVYARYAERPSAGRYLAALVLFALGLMAKPMLVTLPILMLVLDHWPLDRLRPKPSFGRSVFEKVPFLVLAAACAAWTFFAHRRIGMVSTLDAVPMVGRLDNAMGSYLAYVGKTFWPSGLSVLYPYPHDDVPFSRIAVHAAALLLLTALLVYVGRRRRYLRSGWLWFLVALVPVIGLVQSGAQAMADRYTYVGLIGLFWIVAFGAADLSTGLRARTALLASSAILVLLACAVATSAQLDHWRDSAALFRHALEVTPRNDFMLLKYGTLLYEQGKPEESLGYFERALEVRPHPDIYTNYGNALTALGRLDRAVEQYRKALDLDANSVGAHYNLAVAEAAKGEYEEAIRHYEIAIRLDPDAEEAVCNLGCVLLQKGKPARAIEYLQRALDIKPDDDVARRAFAFALAKVGRTTDAIEQFRKVVAARPDDAWAHTKLGILLQGQGDVDRAIESYRRALEIDPHSQEARDRLDALLRGRPGK